MISSVLDAIPLPACALDTEGTIVAVNEPWRDFGRSAGAPEEYCGAGPRYVDILGQGCTQPAALEAITRGLSQVHSGATEEFATNFDCGAFDEPIYIRLRGTLFPAPRGPVVVVTHTDRRELAEAKSETASIAERLELAAAGAGLGLWDYDLRSDQLIWDERQFELFDTPEELFEHTSHSWRRRLHPDDVVAANHALDMAVRGERAFNTSFRVVHRDGTTLTIRGVAEVHRDADGQPIRMVGANWDVTPETRVQEELQAVLQTIPDAVVVLDLDGVVIRANEAVGRAFGLSERDLIGRRIHAFFDDLFSLEEAREGHVIEREISVRRGDGRTIPARVTLRRLPRSGSSQGFVVTAQDLSESYRLREKLKRSERFEAMGRLAGAVAHDFNNLLVAMLTSTELIAAQYDAESRDFQLANNVLEAARRGRDITSQLLLLSRQSANRTRSSCEVAAELEGFHRALGSSIPARIELRTDAPRGLRVGIGSAQLHQILSNLVLNARDAIIGAGEIEVQARRGIEGEVLLFVRDTGSGIPEDMLDEVFEPFVTSKSASKGTGLGLAIVYACVVNAGGSIRVANRIEGGCEFVIRLPGAGPADDATTAAVVPTPSLAGRVLLVDDDPLVLNAVAASLEDLGLHVDAFPNALSALEQLETREYSLMLSDIAMPGMLGTELAVRVRQKQPSLPILLMTGYTTEDLTDVVERAGVQQVLRKPFAQPVLRKAVSDAMQPPGH